MNSAKHQHDDNHRCVSTKLFMLLCFIVICVFTTADVTAQKITMAKETTVKKITPGLCKDNYYYSPTTEQLDEAGFLFKKLTDIPDDHISPRNPDVDHLLVERFKELGFYLTISFINDSFKQIMLTETQADCHGRGSYGINFKVNNHIVIQSPHAFFDTFTGKITEQLFNSGQFFSAAWNSVSRHSVSKTSNSLNPDSPDLSRSRDSYMMRFSLMLAEKFDNARIIQLHGFSQKKRKTRAGRTADVIISNGTQHHSKLSSRLYFCMKKKFVHDNILLYPDDVRELGATGNSIAKQLRAMDSDAFIHIEMSYSFRKKIKNDALQRDQLIQCLVEL